MNKVTMVVLLVSLSTLIYYIEVIKPGVIGSTTELREALNVHT